VPVILASLQSMTQAGRHTFLPDSMSLLGEGIHREHLLSSGQITDSYLLRLAASHGAKLATFDRRIVTSAIAGGDEALLPIPQAWPGERTTPSKPGYHPPRTSNRQSRANAGANNRPHQPRTHHQAPWTTRGEQNRRPETNTWPRTQHS
jgi:hypothetical protein